MAKLLPTKKAAERAVLVGVVADRQKIEQAQEYLDELQFLAQTAGATVEKQFMQRLIHPHPRTYVGEGKLEEIESYVKDHEIDIVIFDDELSPSQLRNLEQVFKCKILDRTNLILDIFATRARSAQAKYQVELAQAQYLLPRLTRMWTHLSKQKGGIGMKGPGETEIETDRRALRNKISKLRERLDSIDKQSQTRRLNRDNKVRVALVGYTNVGKSTLINMLGKADVLAENKLFATLDAVVRQVHFEKVSFLLTDTVGFIRKLPHQLVECFKSTLDEIREAEILLHVIDVSHSNFEEQIRVVDQTLYELGVNEKPIILVFNKVDQLKDPLDIPENETNTEPYINRLKRTWLAKSAHPSVFISLNRKINIPELREVLTGAVDAAQRKIARN
jgi:GTP-binding protein HflX